MSKDSIVTLFSKLTEFFHEEDIVFLYFNGGLVLLPECEALYAAGE